MRTSRERIWAIGDVRGQHVATLSISLLWILFLGACGSSETDRSEMIGASSSDPFPNANTQVAYVGDAACFDCHEDEYQGYQTHGMANSLYRLTEENNEASVPGPVVTHAESALAYRVVRTGTSIVQEERFSNVEGEAAHVLRREMTYVVGSGSAAFTYLAESNGRLYQLPLTWYTQSGRWDFSPGYDEGNMRFGRLVPDRCMACHNSYPESVPHAPGKYISVPEGIGCERCHGPGALHVDARLASPDAPGTVDSTIVNPAHLTLDRRLDVCQQCHLHGDVSILREGRTAFDFRPSQALSAYMALFSVPSASDDAIDVISHADRMQQSPCFLESRGSASPMDCTTCHDPHAGFREAGPAYFNRTCIACHATDVLQAQVDRQMRSSHAADSNCFSCHMPRVEAVDAPHASFTDHFIRVVNESAERSHSGLQDSPELVPYFARDTRGEDGAMYEGIAYIVLGRQENDQALVERGIETLDEVLNKVPDSFGEGHFNLGLALHLMGRSDEAIPVLEESVRRRSDIPERLNALAQAYEASGQGRGRIESLYRRALQIQPALADVRVNLGRYLQARSRDDDAESEYRQAIAEQPWLQTAHFNLGTLLLSGGRLDESIPVLETAVQLEPDHVESRGNLALAYLQRGAEGAAARQFELAVARRPDHPLALANLGAYYLNSGRIEESAQLLERALAVDPEYATAAANLAVAYVNLDRPAEARAAAEAALRTEPGNETALRVLQAIR